MSHLTAVSIPVVTRLILSTFLLVVSVTKSFSCFCSAGGELCNAYWTTDAVFVGRVLDIKGNTIQIARLGGTGRVPESYSSRLKYCKRLEV